MKSLRVGTSVNAGRWRLFPIERTSIGHTGYPHGWWFHGTKELYALVVTGEDQRYALACDGSPMSLKDLTSQVPEIEQALNR